MTAARNKILLCQCIIPDYRLPLFLELRRRLGQRFQLACGDDAFGPALRTVAGARPLAKRLKNFFFLSRTFLWQSGLAREAESADLVIIEFNLRTVSTWRLLALRSRTGRPTIMWGHAAGRRKSLTFLKRWMFKRCQGFIAYTESQRRKLQLEFPGLQVWVAPNAVMWKSECWYIPRPPEQVHSIIYVGRLVHEKKVSLLVQGFARAIQAEDISNDTQLIIVGDGPESDNLQGLANTLGIADRVSFTGRIASVERLRELYASMLLSVSPGCLGLSAMQSFSFGVPILVANNEPHGPELEACQTEFNAQFFESNDVRSIADAILGFYRDKELWLGRRKAISENAGKHYSFDSMADTFITVIESTLEH